MEDVLISLLPIIIVVGVWIFLMRRFKTHFKNNNFGEKQDEMIALLKEIKGELKELNKNNSIK